MAEAEFAVRYDGPALADGRMPVRDLAPALLALGELFTEASLVAYPDREPVSLNIRATKGGSFLVDLAVHSPDAWDRIVQLLSGQAVTALANLQTILFGTVTGGLLWLIKEIRGREIVSKESLPSGHIRLTLSDGAVIEGVPEAVVLYERQSARESAREVVEPLNRPGVERLTFSSDDQGALTIGEGDLPAFDTPEPAEDVLLDREDEAVVALATASFAEGYKWRFSEGDSTFTAAIEDTNFRRRIDAGEAFRKGDMLRVKLRVVQTQRGNKLQVERTVTEVLQHYPRQLQTQIDLGTSESDD